ncbi:MAG: hypothetical protein IK076_06495 [Bacteroidales bacterium]|nr:hypothetical protein [Bacteroidales bacterium]
MTDFERFITENAEADIPRLLLSCKDWPSEKELAISTIEARRKLRKKVPEWYSLTSLVYPSALSAEQCSSSFTASYKASLAARIVGSGGRVADLTGGMGVDSWAFSKAVSQVLYNEKDPSLAQAAGHNFQELDVRNIRVSCREVSPSTLASVVDGFGPDLIFMDPARRSEDGGKVFLLEDCSPDVLRLVPGVFSCCRHLLLKLSPMADISMVVERLDRAYEGFLEKTRETGWNGSWVREIHVVSKGGECKELLVWMDKEWNGGRTLTCVEDSATMSFGSGELSGSKPVFPDSAYGEYLFAPGKSITKAGASNALCGKFPLVKLARSTHLFFLSPSADPSSVEALVPFGRIFKVMEVLPFNKASVREVRSRYPRCEVSARNIPLSSDELRSRLGVGSGDEAFIFGARIELPFGAGNYLVACSRI